MIDVMLGIRDAVADAAAIVIAGTARITKDMLARGADDEAVTIVTNIRDSLTDAAATIIDAVRLEHGGTVTEVTECLHRLLEHYRDIKHPVLFHGAAYNRWHFIDHVDPMEIEGRIVLGLMMAIIRLRKRLESDVSSPERTGWRDQALSERHRQWGFHLPAIDLDFVLLEYDHGRSVAIVEYKNERAFPVRGGHPSYLALKDLANRAALPVFVVRYASDFSWFRITPLNKLAANISSEVQFTECEYMRFLHLLRGRSQQGTVQ